MTQNIIKKKKIAGVHLASYIIVQSKFEEDIKVYDHFLHKLHFIELFLYKNIIVKQ